MALDVMLTDYALTAMCAWFSWQLRKIDKNSIPSTNLQSRELWFFFFASIALATLMGGTAQGFIGDMNSLVYRVTWPISMLSVGITAASAWIIIGKFLNQSIRKWAIFSGILFLIYAFVVLFISQDRNILILNYTPPTLALLLTCIYLFIRYRNISDLWLSVGFLVTFAAAAAEQARLSIHPIYFNHVATYHLVQAVGLWALYRGALYKIKFSNN